MAAAQAAGKYSSSPTTNWPVVRPGQPKQSKLSVSSVVTDDCKEIPTICVKQSDPSPLDYIDRTTLKLAVRNKRGRPSSSLNCDANKKWTCGCGKEYLTYGALFSHTRTKHAGVQPPGSVRLREEQRKPRVCV